MQRRGFLKGMAGILAVGIAPSIITTPGLLMPVRQIVVPPIMAINADNHLVVWMTEERTRLAEKFAVEIEHMLMYRSGNMTATEVLARQEESYRLLGKQLERIIYG